MSAPIATQPSSHALSIARQILDAFGFAGANTIALALASIADELKGMQDEGKFWTPELCVEVAQLIQQSIPDDWLNATALSGEATEPPGPPDSYPGQGRKLEDL